MILSRDVLSIFTLRFLVKDALSIFAQRFLVKVALSISTLLYPLYIYSMILKSQLNSVHKSYHLLIIDFSLKPQSHACSLLIETLIKLFCQLYLLKPFQCRLKSMLILQEPVYCISFSPKIAL